MRSTTQHPTAAADIIHALLLGGPAEDIDDYPAAAIVLARWLDHMDQRAETINDFSTILSVGMFCDRDGWASRLEDGPWAAEARDAIRTHAASLLAHPRWPTLARDGLKSIDGSEFFRAVQAARTLDMDPFDELLARIEDDPLDGPWYQARQNADTTRAALLADRATLLLDLDAIATGPSAETGIGPEFRPHSALAWTLQGIRDHPGIGPHLLAVALQSPSIQNRNGALNALEARAPPTGTISTGLKIQAEHDTAMDALPLHRHDWHRDWNYTLAATPNA